MSGTSTAERTDTGYPIGLSAAVLAMVLFPAAPVLIADSDSNGLVIALWRMWLSVGGLGLIVWLRRGLSWSRLKLTIPAGVAFGFTNAFFYLANQETSVANATLISALQPIPLLLAGWFLFRERTTGRDVVLVVLAVGGSIVAVVASSRGGPGTLYGDLLAVLAMLWGAGYFILGKRARQEIDTLPLMLGVWLWAGVVVAPLVALWGDGVMPASDRDWWRIAVITLVPGSGHALINYAHGRLPLSTIGVLLLAVPIGSSLAAFWFLDQDVSLIQALAMAAVIVALAVFILQRSGRVEAVADQTAV